MFHVSKSSRGNHMLVENSKSQSRNVPLLLFTPLLSCLVSQYRNVLMCFHGKLANLTPESFLEGVHSVLSQPRQKRRVQFLCFMFCKRLKKNFTNCDRSSWACPSKIAVSALMSCVDTCVFIGSISQITSPLRCDYQHPPAITIIT